MAEPDPQRLDHLLEARDRLERQIEMLAAGPAALGSAGSFVDSSGVIAELRETLAEIEGELHELEP